MILTMTPHIILCDGEPMTHKTGTDNDGYDNCLRVYPSKASAVRDINRYQNPKVYFEYIGSTFKTLPIQGNFFKF
jgi:hypothetical protein